MTKIQAVKIPRYRKKSRWSKYIKQARTSRHETQAQFGSRFGVTHVAVSLWESGRRDAPSEVTWWLISESGVELPNAG